VLHGQSSQRGGSGEEREAQAGEQPRSLLGSGLDGILAEEMAEHLAPDPGEGHAGDSPGLGAAEGRLVRDPALPRDDFSGEDLELEEPVLRLFEPDAALGLDTRDLPGETALEESTLSTPSLGSPAFAPDVEPDHRAATGEGQSRDYATRGLYPRGLLNTVLVPLDYFVADLYLPLPAEVLAARAETALRVDDFSLDPDPRALPVLPDDYQVEPGWDALLEHAPAARPSPEEQALIAIARRVAPAVLSLQVWDRFGDQIAKGSGFFISEDGLIMTDVQLIDPELADRIAYVTARTGDGRVYRVNGYMFVEATAGYAILQAEARHTPSVELAPRRQLPSRLEVAVLSVPEDRGLTLADAVVEPEPFLSGEGWLRVSGTDSPGAPGSPVLDDEGRAIAVVSLSVPEQTERWLNFGVPVPGFSEIYDVIPQKPKPLARLSRYQRNIQNSSQFQAVVEGLLGSRWRASAQKLLGLVKRYPRSAEAWALLGLACSKMGATDEALNCHRRALALDEESGQIWYQLSISYLGDRANDPEKLRAAQAALEKVVDERPADRLAYLLLAETWLRLGEYQEAADALTWVIRLEPDLPRIFYLLAVCRGQLGQITGAEAAVRTALELNDEYAKAWFYLGLIHDARRQYADAAEAYRRAVDLDRRHPKAWMNLAHALRRSGKMSSARRALRRHFEVEKQAAQAAEKAES
jgi:tetratricopeptide (TPR) repeat protein